MLRPRFAGTVGKNREASRQNVARAAGRLGTKKIAPRARENSVWWGMGLNSGSAKAFALSFWYLSFLGMCYILPLPVHGVPHMSVCGACAAITLQSVLSLRTISTPRLARCKLLYTSNHTTDTMGSCVGDPGWTCCTVIRVSLLINRITSPTLNGCSLIMFFAPV